jgi:hypothetical protein
MMGVDIVHPFSEPVYERKRKQEMTNHRLFRAGRTEEGLKHCFLANALVDAAGRGHV